MIPFVDIKFWLLAFMLITAYSSISVLLSAYPVRIWLYGSGTRADTPSQGGTIARNLLMICMSLLMIMAYSNTLIVLIALIASVYWTGYKLNALRKERASKVFLQAIILLVLFYFYFKYLDMQLLLNRTIADILGMQPSEKVLVLAGLMIFTLKFIHFLVECYKKRIKNLDFLTFLNYILFFPSFLGPLTRYNQFAEDINNPSVSIEYVSAIRRIIEGLFKKVVLYRFLQPYSLTSIGLTYPSLTRTQAILGIYACMICFYVDGSGTADMAIGSGKLLGINLPEGFNYPFFKKNLQQFWANWNMSVTLWLYDYIYWPLVGSTRRIQKLRTRPLLSANISIIATFAICGLWHEDSIRLLIWGLFQGAGLAIFHFYTNFRRNHFSQKWKQNVTPSWYARAAGTLLTFHFVAFGFLIFCFDLNQIGRLWRLFLP